jgi:hypothetical protein
MSNWHLFKSNFVVVLKVLCISSPWFISDKIERRGVDEPLAPEAKRFVEEELKKHKDLENKRIDLIEWDKTGVFGVSSPTLLLLSNTHYLFIPQGKNNSI